MRIAPQLVPPPKPSVWDFTRQIAARELRVSFRVSKIATLRGLVQPFGVALIFWLLFSQIARSSFGQASAGYPSFALAGLLSWGYFSSMVGGAAGSLTRNALLIRRVIFPRESLVYASLAQPLMQLAFTSTVLSALLLARNGGPANPAMLLWLIPIFIIVTLMATGLGLIVSVACAVGREGQSFVPLMLHLWFFLTPVVYPADSAPGWLARTFAWNPMAMIVSALRRVLLVGAWPDVPAIAIAGIFSVALFAAGRAIFRRFNHVLPEIL